MYEGWPSSQSDSTNGPSVVSTFVYTMNFVLHPAKFHLLTIHAASNHPTSKLVQNRLAAKY